MVVAMAVAEETKKVKEVEEVVDGSGQKMGRVEKVNYRGNPSYCSV